jgi:hypothetical protein
MQLVSRTAWTIQSVCPVGRVKSRGTKPVWYLRMVNKTDARSPEKLGVQASWTQVLIRRNMKLDIYFNVLKIFRFTEPFRVIFCHIYCTEQVGCPLFFDLFWLFHVFFTQICFLSLGSTESHWLNPRGMHASDCFANSGYGLSEILKSRGRGGVSLLAELFHWQAV